MPDQVDPAQPLIRQAQLKDVPGIVAIISGFASQRLMLSRTPGEIYETFRNFVVADLAGQVVGCCALHVFSPALAEVKSLAVAEAHQDRGLGRALVGACLADAAHLGLDRVFCLTYQETFFRNLGFQRVDRSRLPDKVWGECVRCDRFLCCDEIPMWRLVRTPGACSDLPA